MRVSEQASIEEWPDLSSKDLLSLTELIDEWETSIRNLKNPPRLVILPDCCYKDHSYHILNHGTEQARARALRIRMSRVSITRPEVMDDSKPI